MGSPKISSLPVVGNLLSSAGGAAAGATAAAGGATAAVGAAALLNNPVAKIAKTTLAGAAGIAAGAGLAAAFRASPADVLAAQSLGEKWANQNRANLNPLTYTRDPKQRILIVNNFKGRDKPLVVKAWIPESVSLDVSAQYSALFGQGVFEGDNLFNQGAKTFGFSGITREMSYKVWQSSQGVTMQLPLVFTLDDTLLELDGDSNPSIIEPILQLKRLCLPSKVPGQPFLEPPGTSVRLADNAVTQGLAAFSEGFNEVTTAAGEQLGNLGTNASRAIQNTLGIGNSSNQQQDYKDVSATPVLKSMGDALANIGDALFDFQSWTSIYIGNFLYFDKVVIDSVSSTFDMQMDTEGKPIRATVNVQFTTLFDTTVQDLNSIFLLGTTNSQG